MSKSRVRYSKEFKAHAVGKIGPGGESLTHTARVLGISPGMLSKWVKASRESCLPEGNIPVTPEFEGLSQRVGRLEESIRILRRILETSLGERAYRGIG